MEIEMAEHPQAVSLSLVHSVMQIAAIGAWRYGQGIYRFDPELLPALLDSPVSGSLPSEVLYRLPEWSIYVETPGMCWMDAQLFGFWAHLEWDRDKERVELRFLFDCDNGLIGQPLHLGNWTITEAVDRVFSEAKKQPGYTFTPGLIEKTAEDFNPIISMLLYLCSDSPEIDDARVPGTSPHRAEPKKTKKGLRLFPAPAPRVWAVGTEIGGQLRSASMQEHDSTGKKIRAHLRRGHWHGYWTGPKTEKQKFSYRWISPLVVAG